MQHASPIKKNKPLFYFFVLATLLGIALAIYIYIFNFNTYSETTMIMLSPVWLLPIIFGYYGRLALKMQRRLEESEHKTMAEMIDFVIQSVILHYIGLLFYLPFRLGKHQHPIIVATIGAILWAGLLSIFLIGIFPML